MRKIGTAKVKSYFKCNLKQDRANKRQNKVVPGGGAAGEKTLTQYR